MHNIVQNSQPPLISIVISVHNEERFLAPCLDSILNQSLQNIEVIIIDDASNDNTSTVISEYKKKDQRIIGIHNKTNIGAGLSRNIGLEMASGVFITFFDGDDLYCCNKVLEKIYNEAIKYDAKVLCGNALTGEDIKSSLPIIYNGVNLNFNSTCYKSPNEIHQLWIPFFHPRFIYKKSFLIDNNITFPSNIRGEDPIFITKVFINTSKILCIREKLFFYRLSEGSKISTNAFKDYISHIIECSKLFDEHNLEKQKIVHSLELIKILSIWTENNLLITPGVDKNFQEHCFLLIKNYVANLSYNNYDSVLPFKPDLDEEQLKELFNILQKGSLTDYQTWFQKRLFKSFIFRSEKLTIRDEIKIFAKYLLKKRIFNYSSNKSILFIIIRYIITSMRKIF